MESKGRSGKKVTIIHGFTRRPEELEELATFLKKAVAPVEPSKE